MMVRKKGVIEIVSAPSANRMGSTLKKHWVCCLDNRRKGNISADYSPVDCERYHAADFLSYE